MNRRRTWVSLLALTIDDPALSTQVGTANAEGGAKIGNTLADVANNTGTVGIVGAHLVGHKQVDFVAFTGSRAVGTKIWETAGRTQPGQQNLKKVVCEMGGKNALVIDNDADLDEAIPAALYTRIVDAFAQQGNLATMEAALTRMGRKADGGLRPEPAALVAALGAQVGVDRPDGALAGVVRADLHHHVKRTRPVFRCVGVTHHETPPAAPRHHGHCLRC